MAHRVQRVPETEAQGRIHTSAATVAVLPEAEAAPYARAATVPQDPLRLYPMIHLARAQLGLGQPQQAPAGRLRIERKGQPVHAADDSGGSCNSL